MPFVRIDTTADFSPEMQKKIADGVHAALVEAVRIPADDRFQVISTHAGGIIHDRTYLGIHRSDEIVMIEIHLSFGRSLEIKQALFAAIHARLVALGEDIMVHLVETEAVNWSFGLGIAQYAEKPPEHLAAL